MVTGEELKKARTKLELTQVELGAALGIPSNTIARWERGEMPIEKPKLLGLAVEHLRCKSKKRTRSKR